MFGNTKRIKALEKEVFNLRLELENIKSYELELTITRPGSDYADMPVSFEDCAFEITVKPWTVVAVTDGIVI